MSFRKFIAKSLVSAGLSEEEAVLEAQGYSEPVKTQAATDYLSMKCPRCSSQMNIVELEGGRKIKYCSNDRVALPMAV